MRYRCVRTSVGSTQPFLVLCWKRWCLLYTETCQCKGNKPDTPALQLETGSIPNTTALFTCAVFSSILQNNRSWHQAVRLWGVRASPLKAWLTKVRCSHNNKKNHWPFILLCTSQFEACISSCVILESCFSWDFRFSSGWQETKLGCCPDQWNWSL